MRLLKGLVLLAPLFSIIPFSAAQNNTEIRCEDTAGCFRLIETAIQNASSGTTLLIAPGLYYEKPLHVNKSLTLQGTFAITSTGSSMGTVIQFVDTNGGILIENAEISGSMIVQLQNLTLISLTSEQLEVRPSPFNITTVSILNTSSKREDLNVTISGVKIRGEKGIRVSNSRLTLKENSIYSTKFSLLSVRSDLAIEGNTLRGGTSIGSEGDVEGVASVILFDETSARLVENNILSPPLTGDRASPHWAVYITGETGSIFGPVNAYLEGNYLSGKSGLVLDGSTSAEVIGNQFAANPEYGLLVSDIACSESSIATLYSTFFTGNLTGRDNVFWGNGADVCPEDYPLPDGFIKSSGS